MLPNMLILSHFCIPQLALLPKNPLSTVNVYAMIGEDGVRLIDPCSEERQLARPLLPWSTSLVRGQLGQTQNIRR